MAIVKYRMREKKSDGTYDILYPETSTDNVKHGNNRTLNDILIINDTTLASGQSKATVYSNLIGDNKALSFYTSIEGVNPFKVEIYEGRAVLYFYPQEEDMIVGVRVDA